MKKIIKRELYPVDDLVKNKLNKVILSLDVSMQEYYDEFLNVNEEMMGMVEKDDTNKSNSICLTVNNV